MTTPIEARELLESYARELDLLSKQLAELERNLEPVEQAYQQQVDDFELGLWHAHVSEGDKLPSADLRLKLARQAMNPVDLGRYEALTHSRRRLERRISTLAKAADAQRSVLSALKVELEAAA